MTNPTAAILVIGDEILSGRTRDSNMHYLAGELTRIGITLREARVVADVHAEIVAAVRELAGRYTHLFTSGGIGPTHDDITADAVAEAMGAKIGHRADAMALLQAHYDRSGLPFNEARQRMARIGARLARHVFQRAARADLGLEPVGGAVERGEAEQLVQDHGPRAQRGEDQADHHPLHNPIGLHEQGEEREIGGGGCGGVHAGNPAPFGRLSRSSVLLA